LAHRLFLLSLLFSGAPRFLRTLRLELLLLLRLLGLLCLLLLTEGLPSGD